MGIAQAVLRGALAPRIEVRSVPVRVSMMSTLALFGILMLAVSQAVAEEIAPAVDVTRIGELAPKVARVAGPNTLIVFGEDAKPLGRINPFWRTTPIPDRALEHHGAWVMDLPAVFEDAPRYRKHRPAHKVIPFTDTVSTVRLLGGWKPWRPEEGVAVRDHDLVYRKGEALAYRWDRLHARIGHFLDNDMDLLVVLDNVPYCFLTDAKLGTYGQVKGPEDAAEYGEFIKALVEEIVRKYGRHRAEKLRFRIGTEPDLPGHWSDSVETYCRMYDHAAAAIKDVLPDAPVGPGNFLSRMVGTKLDGIEIMKHLASGRNYATGEAGSPVDFLAVSIYYAPKQGSFGNRDLMAADSHDKVRAAAGKLKKYQALSPRFADIPLEIHEFGVLTSELAKTPATHRPGGRGVRSGAWVLQAYVAALDEGITEIFYWRSGQMTRLRGTSEQLLTGAGWLRAMLDLGVGGEWYIPKTALATKNGSSVMALASAREDAIYIFSSIYNLHRVNEDESFQFKIDLSKAKGLQGKALAVREYYQNRDSSVIETIHRDLKRNGQIMEEFDNGEIYDPATCASPEGRAFIKRNQRRYSNIMSDSFRSKNFTGEVNMEGGVVTLTREVSTPSMLILEIRVQ